MAWEEGSTTTFGSELLQTLRAVYEEGSQTTFGSELLLPIKVKGKHSKVEVDGSITTFGSEQLMKSTIRQQDPNAIPKPGSKKVVFDSPSVASSRQSSRASAGFVANMSAPRSIRNPFSLTVWITP